jgi:hypothetical protein
MYQAMLNLTSQIVPFMAVMGQVVAIWGFLNFMNQLSLQNLTLVADRALSRLPNLKNKIFILKNCSDQDIDQIDESLDQVNEIIKRLYMDIKQLGIAKDYNLQKSIVLLSDQNPNRNRVKMTYLEYEMGQDWNIIYKSSTAMKIPFIQNLEAQLLNIFDLSHGGQTFVNHLSTNVVRITWVSLIIYLLEMQDFVTACFVVVLGAMVWSVAKIYTVK